MKLTKMKQWNLKYEYFSLFLIVLLAVGLRVYKLGEWSFWGDEVITVVRSSEMSWAKFLRRGFSTWGTHMAMNWWGVSEWSARFVPAVIGMLSIPVLYFFTRKLFGVSVALASSALLAISPWHIYWSQNARFYTALLLFYTISLFLFYLGMEEDRPLYLLLSLGFLVFAMQERFVAGFLVPITAAYVVLLKLFRFELPSGFSWRNLALYFGPSILGGMLVTWQFDPFGFFSPSPQLEEAFGFTNTSPLWIAGGVIFYVGVPLAVMSVVGAFLLLKEKDRAGLFFGLSAGFPLAAVMLISLLQYAANRYVLVSLTSIILLGGIAVVELFRHLPSNGKILAVGVALILLAAPMSDNLLYYQYQHGNRDNWKDALAYIEAHKGSDDLVVSSHRIVADYYLDEETIGMQSIHVEDLTNATEPVWILVELTTPEKAPRIYQWVLENANLVSIFDVTVSARSFPMRVYSYNP